MTQKITYFLIALLLSAPVFCQPEKLLRGRISVKDAMPSGVHVLNLVNEKETISDENGNFAIAAKTDDVLIFSAIHLDLMRHIIDEKEYASGDFTIEMTSKINELEEVSVNNIRLDAFKLGILDKPAKRYTVAQRRLYTAQTGPVDILVNALTGRTRMLKRAYNFEKKEMLLQKLDGMFEEKFYTDKLRIAPDKIVAFHYFVIEDAKVAAALRAKNKLLVATLLPQLAKDFNKTQADGPK